MANEAGLRLPLHVLNTPHLTALMSALLGVPPPVYSRGMLPKGMLNASLRYEANAMLINAKQLLAQARRLRELHPKRMPDAKGYHQTDDRHERSPLQKDHFAEQKSQRSQEDRAPSEVAPAHIMGGHYILR